MHGIQLVQRRQAIDALRSAGLAELVADFRVLANKSGSRNLLFLLIARLIHESSNAEQCDCGKSDNKHVSIGSHAPFYGRLYDFRRDICNSHDQHLSSGNRAAGQ
jgi:hypothetical protein